MRLQTKVAQYYLLAAAATFIVCGMLSFFLIRREITRDIDERLLLRKAEIDAMIPRIADIGSIGNTLVIKKTGGAGSTEATLSDTALFDETEGEYLPFRQLRYYSSVNGTLYRIVLRQSLIESEDLSNGILPSLSVVFGLFVVLSVVINTIINKRLLKPFYVALDLMNSFDVTTIPQEMPMILYVFIDFVDKSSFQMDGFSEMLAFLA